ncbi:MAG: YfiR family protein [Steroidobacteraceae bacterium]
MRRLFTAIVALGLVRAAFPAELPEYRVKAAFLYNFAQYTDWPTSVAKTLHLCTYGADPFGQDLDAVGNKAVGERTLLVRRRVTLEALNECQLLYVSREMVGTLPKLLQKLDGHPVLVITDSPGAAEAGSMINMSVAQSRVTFEANRRAARAAGLDLRSPLLRLATGVIQ